MLWGKCLRNLSMDSASIVLQAQKKLRDLIRDESRGWGDDRNAVGRIAARLRIPFSYLWRLLYRAGEMKDIRSTVFLKLSIAHNELRERQMRRMEHERGETTASTWLTQNLVRAGDLLAGESNRENHEKD